MGNEQGEKPGSSSWGTGGLLRNDGWAEVWNKNYYRTNEQSRTTTLINGWGK